MNCGVFLCILVNFVVFIWMHTVKFRVFLYIPVNSKVFLKMYFWEIVGFTVVSCAFWSILLHYCEFYSISINVLYPKNLGCFCVLLLIPVNSKDSFKHISWKLSFSWRFMCIVEYSCVFLWIQKYYFKCIHLKYRVFRYIPVNSKVFLKLYFWENVVFPVDHMHCGVFFCISVNFIVFLQMYTPQI